MVRLAALVAIAISFVTSTSASAIEPATGNWKVIMVGNYHADFVDCIVKLDKADGKWTATLVSTSPFVRDLKVRSVTVKNDRIELAIDKGKSQLMFEGRIADDKKVIGSYGDDRRVTGGRLEWTEDEKLDRRTFQLKKEVPPPLAELDKLESAIAKLNEQLRKATDNEEKKKLQEELKAKRKSHEQDTNRLFQEVIAKHSDDPAAYDVAVLLVRGAQKRKATVDDVRKWSAIAMKQAAGYGPRFEKEILLNLADYLAPVPAYRDIAVEYARKSTEDFGTQASLSRQARALTALVRAMGTAPEAARYAQRLAQVETALDQEYIAKHAKLVVEPYRGRKEGANRTLLVEMFTGAQCPPCVAADIAFDKILEKYKPEDVILMQYHVHIPGPDPMATAETDARMDYYEKAYPYDAKNPRKPAVRGVPCPLFNGCVDDIEKHQGGGPEDDALKVLAEFREVIDPILDERADASIAVKATRAGDVVTMSADISGLSESRDGLKLRFALVEETVRYPGGNGIRFHHHVVRAMPGGVDGVPLTSSHDTRQVTVNVAELRNKLNKYLDEWAEKREVPFPKPYRPMDMKKLKAIAWIQDDKSEKRTVLATAIADVKDSAGAQ